MANIIIEVQGEIYNGMPVAFKAPCDCAGIECLKIKFADGERVFYLVDAHKNLLPMVGNAFIEGAVVKAILDTDDGTAFLQNADTNSYLEGRFSEIGAAAEKAYNASQRAEEGLYNLTQEVGNIGAALDELHAYAQTFIGGGA